MTDKGLAILGSLPYLRGFSPTFPCTPNPAFLWNFRPAHSVHLGRTASYVMGQPDPSGIYRIRSMASFRTHNVNPVVVPDGASFVTTSASGNSSTTDQVPADPASVSGTPIVVSESLRSA